MATASIAMEALASKANLQSILTREKGKKVSCYVSPTIPELGIIASRVYLPPTEIMYAHVQQKHSQSVVLGGKETWEFDEERAEMLKQAVNEIRYIGYAEFYRDGPYYDENLNLMPERIVLTLNKDSEPKEKLSNYHSSWNATSAKFSAYACGTIIAEKKHLNNPERKALDLLGEILFDLK